MPCCPVTVAVVIDTTMTVLVGPRTVWVWVTVGNSNPSLSVNVNVTIGAVGWAVKTVDIPEVENVIDKGD